MQNLVPIRYNKLVLLRVKFPGRDNDLQMCQVEGGERGKGGGSRSKSQIFFILTYLEIWIIPRLSFLQNLESCVCCRDMMFRSWALRTVFRVFVWKIIWKIMKKLIYFSSKKSDNFSSSYSILAILGQVIGKTETKNL